MQTTTPTAETFSAAVARSHERPASVTMADSTRCGSGMARQKDD